MIKGGDVLKKVLSIAGSDPSGGAGIQADLKTASALGIYGMSVITALTAQNTLGVSAVQQVEKDFFKAQLEAVLEDIVPDGVKIGMMGAGFVPQIIFDAVEKYSLKNIVIDPVLIATSGGILGSKEILKAAEPLMKKATLITPNIFEAEEMSGIEIKCKKDMEEAGRKIFQDYGSAVLVKGGHRLEDADDLLFAKDGIKWIKGKHIDNPNNHGTGCTLSTAITCRIAEGKNLEEAVVSGKKFVTFALEKGTDIGKGNGPINHCFKG